VKFVPPPLLLLRASARVPLLTCTNPELACEVTLQPLRRFALDAAILFSDILTIPDAMGLGLYFESGEGPRFRKTVRNAADVTALPQLEKLALRNNRRALEAVALLADRDQAATLTRVWRSGSLTMPRLVDATRFLAATMEINPDAEQLLRGLAADPNADARVLYAAVDGLANPNFPVSFEHDAAVPGPPHFKPDFAARIRMLENLRPSFTDADLRGYVDQVRAELQTRGAESNTAAP